MGGRLAWNARRSNSRCPLAAGTSHSGIKLVSGYGSNSCTSPTLNLYCSGRYRPLASHVSLFVCAPVATPPSGANTASATTAAWSIEGGHRRLLEAPYNSPSNPSINLSFANEISFSYDAGACRWPNWKQSRACGVNDDAATVQTLKYNSKRWITRLVRR